MTIVNIQNMDRHVFILIMTFLLLIGPLVSFALLRAFKKQYKSSAAFFFLGLVLYVTLYWIKI